MPAKKLNNRTNRSHTNTNASTFDYTSNSSNALAQNTHYSSTSATITPKLPEVVNKSKEGIGKKPGSSSTQSEPEFNAKNLTITGDDVLIEYVARLMIAIKSIKLRQAWKNSIEKFIRHYVWHTSDTRRRENNKLWQRLESRLIEMKERRKRLLRSLYKKEVTTGLFKKEKSEINAEFEKEYDIKEQQKNVIIQALSALELEDMLRTSTKNVAHEVVS